MVLQISIVVNAFTELTAQPSSILISYSIDNETLKANNIETNNLGNLNLSSEFDNFIPAE